jgi:hypothetical protein
VGGFQRDQQRRRFRYRVHERAATGSHVKSRACRRNMPTRRRGKLARRLPANERLRSRRFRLLGSGQQMATGDAQASLAIIPYMDKRLDDEFQRLAAESNPSSRRRFSNTSRATRVRRGGAQP